MCTPVLPNHPKEVETFIHLDAVFFPWKLQQKVMSIHSCTL